MRLNLRTITLTATLLLATLASFKASAQINFSYRDSLGTYKVRFYPHVESDDPATRFRVPLVSNTTELRIGIATAAYTPFGSTNNNWWEIDFDFDKLENNQQVSDIRWYTTELDAGVWIKEWLYVGGTFVYTGGFRRVTEGIFKRPVKTYNLSCYSLMPTLRFAWVRQNVVQLYSGLGLGFSITHYDQNEQKYWTGGIAYDLTFVGISVGRQFFGYCDLGMGSRGIVTAGLGLRF